MKTITVNKKKSEWMFHTMLSNVENEIQAKQFKIMFSKPHILSNIHEMDGEEYYNNILQINKQGVSISSSFK
jgi:hypothetical protein